MCFHQKHHFKPHLEAASPLHLVVNALVLLDNWAVIGTTIVKSFATCCQLYPKSFKDDIEGEVVGSGYDSLTKQLQCRVGNYKRSDMLGKKRIIPDDISSVPENKKLRKDSYGCIRWESGPVNLEAQMTKKKDHGKWEELKTNRTVNLRHLHISEKWHNVW